MRPHDGSLSIYGLAKRRRRTSGTSARIRSTTTTPTSKSRRRPCCWATRGSRPRSPATSTWLWRAARSATRWPRRRCFINTRRRQGRRRRSVQHGGRHRRATKPRARVPAARNFLDLRLDHRCGRKVSSLRDAAYRAGVAGGCLKSEGARLIANRTRTEKQPALNYPSGAARRSGSAAASTL